MNNDQFTPDEREIIDLLSKASQPNLRATSLERIHQQMLREMDVVAAAPAAETMPNLPIKLLLLVGIEVLVIIMIIILQGVVDESEKSVTPTLINPSATSNVILPVTVETDTPSPMPTVESSDETGNGEPTPTSTLVTPTPHDEISLLATQGINTPTSTVFPTNTRRATSTPAVIATSSPLPTNTLRPSVTASVTLVPSATATLTLTSTATLTPTRTPGVTATHTLTNPSTATPTLTSTATFTTTPTSTPLPPEPPTLVPPTATPTSTPIPDPCVIPAVIPGNTIYGRVFEDINYTGIPQAYEPGVDQQLGGVQVNITAQSNGQTFTGYTNSCGVFSIISPESGLHTVDYAGLLGSIGDADTLPTSGYNGGFLPGSAVPALVYAPGAAINLGGAAGYGDTHFGFSYEAITNTNDSGSGSLRQFILNANAIPGGQISRFVFTDGADKIFAPLSQYPTLTDSGTVINGFNIQPTGTRVILNGSVTIPNAFFINTSGITIRGIETHSFLKDAVLVGSPAFNVIYSQNNAYENGDWALDFGLFPDGDGDPATAPLANPIFCDVPDNDTPTITGYAAPGNTVEIYRLNYPIGANTDNGFGEGQYIGSVVADGTGFFAITISLGINDKVTAIALNGSTSSEFRANVNRGYLLGVPPCP